MVDSHRCYYCGSIVDRPVIFTLTVQRIFDFIWNHPNTTTREIEMAIYGRHLIRTTNITVAVSKIRKELKGTGYWIRSTRIQKAPGISKNWHCVYKILPTSGPAHDTP